MPFPIEASALPYLRGAAFSSGYHFPLPGPDPAGFLTDRLLHLESACRGKRVLHLGCCDHLPLIRQKIASDTWLHARLTRAAGACLGTDIARDAIDAVRNEHGYANVIHADLSVAAPPEVQAGKPWDTLVAGEIVEHLDNPVQFLSNLRASLRGLCGEMIVTVPNAFRRTNYRHLLEGTEFINSDHRFWFTPYTMAKVFAQAGFTPLRYSLVESAAPRRARGLRAACRQWMLRRHPALRDVLIMEAALA